MSPPAEDLSGLHPLPIDPDAAEALLAGTTPPGFEQLSAWLSAARPAPAGPDDPLEQLAVGALTGAAAPRAGAGGGRLAPRLLTAKTVAIAIATTIALGGTSAAAATGTLPSPVQSALARSLRHLGLTLPDTAATRNPTGAGAHPLPTHTSTSGTSGTADPALTRPDRSASSPARSASSVGATPGGSASSRRSCGVEGRGAGTAGTAGTAGVSGAASGRLLRLAGAPTTNASRHCAALSTTPASASDPAASNGGTTSRASPRAGARPTRSGEGRSAGSSSAAHRTPPPETPPAQVGHRAPDHHGSRPDELGGHRDLSRPRPAGHR